MAGKRKRKGRAPKDTPLFFQKLGRPLGVRGFLRLVMNHGSRIKDLEDLRQCTLFVGLLHGAELARKAGGSGFEDLPFGIALFRSIVRPEQVAHDFGDRGRSPELIFASYSWARRDHMVRFTFGLPFRQASASCIVLSDDNLRMPTLSALLVGTRSVMRSFSKRST